MSKIEIKDLYLVFGNEKQKALKMLKEGKTKSEILKATGCTVLHQPFDTPYFRRSDYQWNRHSQSVG